MCKSLKLLSFLGGVDKLPLFYYNYSMSKEIENKNKREVDMKTTVNRYEQTVEIKDLDINLNGIQGADAILDMIKDTIDDGKTEDAKDWITQLQDELYDNGVRG